MISKHNLIIDHRVFLPYINDQYNSFNFKLCSLTNPNLSAPNFNDSFKTLIAWLYYFFINTC